ncbi:MAG: TrmH family RNA methyltransferase [Bacteroidota bacterium]
MSLQHSHESTPFTKKKNNLVLLCDGVSGPANIGSLFRLCDAFGVKEILFCNAEIDLSSPRLKKTARNTETRVPFRCMDATEKLLEDHKAVGYIAVGLEITSESIPIQGLGVPQDANILLVIGSEQHGISESVLAALECTVHIEMFGSNSSMNVAQAAGIALFELTKS